MSDNQGVTNANDLNRVLGRRDTLLLAFGAMIGWSWVLLTGTWIENAGTFGTAIAFCVGGVALVLIGLTYAELASAMPKAGGEHVYSHRAFGPGVSFVCTWALLMGYVTIPVFEAVALPVALIYLFPAIEVGRLWTIGGADVYFSSIVIGIGATAIVTIINVIGIRIAAIVQTIAAFVLLLTGAVFIFGALGAGELSNAEPYYLGITGVMSVLIMVPTMMVGFDVIPQSAEEIDLPREVIGKLIVVAVACAIGWYALIAIATGFSLDAEGRGASSITTAAAMAAVWGDSAGKWLVIGGIAGILTSWNAFIIGGSRVLLSLARAGMIAPAFGAVHPRFHTPHVAVLFIGALALIGPFFGQTILVWLVDAGSFAIVVAYGIVAASFLKLRRDEPQLARPFRVRHGGLVGSAALLMSIALFMIYLPWSPSALVWPQEWAMVLGWVLLGIVFYRLAPAVKRK